MFENGDIVAVPLNGCGANNLRLRNVAPPKSGPVLIEGWVNLVKASTAYEGGTYWIIRNGAVWQTKDAALSEADKMPDVIGTACIRLMSDGSPVPGEDDPLRYGVCETCVEKAVKRCDELMAERESLKAEVERLTQHAYLLEISEGDLERDRNNIKTERDNAVSDFSHAMKLVRSYATKIDRLETEVGHLSSAGLIMEQKAEIARMRPVVDAAVAWASLAQYNPPLLEAVRTYQSSPKKTAEEAVANVAEMLGPVKLCGTCRFHCNVAIESCTENGHRGWEAKSEPVKSCDNCRHDKNVICSLFGPFDFDGNGDCQDWEMKNG
jgi:hypothetical protein